MSDLASAERAPVPVGSRLRQALGPLVVAYLFRVAGGAAIAGPATLAVSRLVSHVPGGDRDLLKNGGVLLLEALWRCRPDFGGWVRVAGLTGAVVAILGLVPLSLLLVAVASPARVPLRACLSDGLRLVPTYAVLLGVAALAESILLVAGLQVVSAFFPAVDSPTHALVAGALLLSASAPAFLVSMLHDLARVVAASSRVGFWDAVGGALTVGWRHWLRVSGERLLAGLASLGLLVLGLGAPLAVGLGTAPRWLVSTAIGQLSLASLVLVRATYLARLAVIVGDMPPPGEHARGSEP